MIHRFAGGLVAAAISVLFSGEAVAAQAPRLPLTLFANANGLQRAAWACEAGAPVLTATSTTGKSGPARYFLSGAGDAGTAEPPLVLGPSQLRGLGWLSDDRGWSVIRFRCALTPDLRQATAFSYSVLARAKPPTSEPTTAGSPDVAASRPKIWSVDIKRGSLSYGMPETDDIDVWARCKPHSGQIALGVSRTVQWLKQGGYVVVSLGDGTHSGLYLARGFFAEEPGAIMPEVSIAAGDPLFTWMASGKTLLVNVGRDIAYSVPLAGAAGPVRAFAGLCAR